NDGSVQGKRYFECQTDHGVFVRSSQVKVLMTSSSGGSGDGSAGVGGDAAGQQQGGSRLLRSTIHGAEVQQGAGEQRPRPPAAATEGLRAVRRATMQPGRTMAPAAFGGPPAGAVSAQSSIMATPAGGSRLGGPLGQRPALSGQAGQTPSGIGSGPIGVAGSASALQKARRISDVQSLGPRRATLSGARSPGIPGGRSSSRQTVGSDGGSLIAVAPAASSRPASREHFARVREETPTPTPTPTKSRRDSLSGATGEADNDGSSGTDANGVAPATGEEAPRTPYRPALSMSESSTFDSAATPAATMSSQTVSLKQFEELRLKYKFLEQKRSEDRQRIQEAEKIRSEAEQALRVRDKLAAKVAAQQEEARQLRQRLKEVGSLREEAEAKYADTLESMEMLAVDKEMAEERAETLAQEASALREQLDEASTNLEVIRQEDGGGRGVAGLPAGLPAVEYAQLQKQNERLKEALMRLRD
ncbi:hypothetical protein H4R26_005791, partial [Coemansia thaxteri]